MCSFSLPRPKIWILAFLWAITYDHGSGVVAALGGSSFCGGMVQTRYSGLARVVGTTVKRTAMTKLEALSEPDVVPSSGEQKLNVETLSKALDNCRTAAAAQAILSETLDGEQSLYGSVLIAPGASEKRLSDADLAIQTNIRNSKYSIMELIELNGDRDADRASLALLSVLVACSGSSIVANQALFGKIPEILRFVVVWLLSFAPLAFVGYGIATPALLQALLVNIQRNLFPTYRKRMIQHEAGHFLMGHLLGLPIQSYQANAVKNAVEFYPLNDADAGTNRASLLGFDSKRNVARLSDDNSFQQQRRPDQPFFSPDGRGGDDLAAQSVFRKDKNYTDLEILKLPSRDEPRNAWPYRGFDATTLDSLSVVSVGGVCAELLAFGNAEGGYADLSQLRQFMASSSTELTDQEMQNKIRFALGYTVATLRRHLGALDALAEVMERDGSIAECIAAIEECESVSGLSKNDALMGLGVVDCERRRKESFRPTGILKFVESALLGGGKNADTEANDVVYGKGGGDRKEKFVMTGDDPFYAAVAVAGIFFLWAEGGGLTLH